MSILPGTKAPWFSSVGFQEGAFYDISLNDFNSDGKWLVLFFYPLDFGYISPSELVALEARRGELEGLGCRLVAVSQDSAVSHHRFGDIHCGFGGVFGLGFPLVEDPAGAISRLYGVDRAGAGRVHRAYFIIDPEPQWS
jgi:peroxiredoxin (alkyl hydroperoxide reductase subunit C)